MNSKTIRMNSRDNRTYRRLATAIGISLASLLFASAATASTTWDFRNGGSPETQIGTAWGNIRTFTMGADAVSVTAWADDGTTPPMSFRSAHSGQYDTGLGICNRSEAQAASSLSACDTDGGFRDQVDNVGNNDFMLFIFSSAQTFQSITIDPFGALDRDVSWWIGTVTTSASPPFVLGLTGSTPSGLGSFGFGPRNDSFNGVGDPPLTINLGNATGNAILFGALYPPDASSDKFKVQSMVTMSTSVVPVPAAVWLLGSALGTLAGLRRRCRAN